MSLRPRIGITAEERTLDLEVLVADCVVVAREYARAVWAAGGMPVILPVLQPEDADEIVAQIDGLVLTGGGDVEPEYYGSDRHERTYGVVTERDAFEVALVRAVERLNRPALGICRGLQLLNVAHEGSLDVHVPEEPIQHWQGHFGDAHTVTIAGGSRLAAIYGPGEHEVNSFHHQASGRVGPGLRVTAIAADGTVEALELEDDGRWLVGVQWHPERPWDASSSHLPLFRALVEQASNGREPSLSADGQGRIR